MSVSSHQQISNVFIANSYPNLNTAIYDRWFNEWVDWNIRKVDFFRRKRKISCNSSVSQTLFVPAFSHLEDKTKEDQNDSLDNL